MIERPKSTFEVDLMSFYYSSKLNLVLTYNFNSFQCNVRGKYLVHTQEIQMILYGPLARILG